VSTISILKDVITKKATEKKVVLNINLGKKQQKEEELFRKGRFFHKYFIFRNP
jgi:hypothetical protein